MRDTLVRGLNLVLDSIDDALDRWLEERGDLFTGGGVSEEQTLDRLWRLPCDLQLPKADPAVGIVVPGRTKLDVLGLRVVTESNLRRAIKAADDMV